MILTILMLGYGGLLGAIAGSTLTTLIPRNEEERHLHGKARSTCPACRRTLTWFELIPLASFVALRGKCRTCRHPIPRSYATLEGVGALLGVVTAYVIHERAYRFPASFFTAGIIYLLLWCGAYDARHRKIPLAPVAAFATLALVEQTFLRHDIRSALLGAAALGSFFLAQFIASRGRWLGEGDIWLGGAIGVWLGFPLGAYALVIAYTGGALCCIALLYAKRITRETPLPLGTFLAAGAVAAWLLKNKLLHLL